MSKELLATDLKRHSEEYPDRTINRLNAVIDLLKNISQCSDLIDHPHLKDIIPQIQQIIYKQASILAEIRELLMTNNYDSRYINEKLIQIQHANIQLSRIKKEKIK